MKQRVNNIEAAVLVRATESKGKRKHYKKQYFTLLTTMDETK